MEAFDRWVLRERCAIPGQSLPESELEFERQEETYQDQKAAWDACTIENNKPQTSETCHANPPHPQWALTPAMIHLDNAVTAAQEGELIPPQCSICAELAAPAPCGVQGHTLATWKGLTEHEPDCSCAGDTVKHGQACANCDCDFKTAHCLRCAEVAKARDAALIEAAKGMCIFCGGDPQDSGYDIEVIPEDIHEIPIKHFVHRPRRRGLSYVPCQCEPVHCLQSKG